MVGELTVARWRRWLGGWGTAMLAGAFVLFAFGRADEPKNAGHALGLLAFGALYGLAVLGVLRLFRTRRFGLIAAGLIAGPVPLAVLQDASTSKDQRLGAVVFACLFGLALGVLEWARTSDSST